jgi:ApaG protein
MMWINGTFDQYSVFWSAYMNNLDITSDIVVKAVPVYLEKESSTMEPKHVFAYHIEIYNNGYETVQLIKRHWEINDNGGEDYIVEGQGVIGKKPHIAPGQSHRYQSFCVLKGMTGSMKGWFEFVRADGVAVKAIIPQFNLVSHLLN